jgi:hypothetical protein
MNIFKNILIQKWVLEVLTQTIFLISWYNHELMADRMAYPRAKIPQMDAV